MGLSKFQLLMVICLHVQYVISSSVCDPENDFDSECHLEDSLDSEPNEMYSGSPANSFQNPFKGRDLGNWNSDSRMKMNVSQEEYDRVFREFVDKDNRLDMLNIPFQMEETPGFVTLTLSLREVNATRLVQANMRAEILQGHGAIILDNDEVDETMTVSALDGNRWGDIDLTDYVAKIAPKTLTILAPKTVLRTIDSQLKPVLTVISDTRHSAVSSCSHRPRYKNRCCMRELEVRFKDLEAFSYILAPSRYDFGYCKGGCPVRHVPLTHHAFLQQLLSVEEKFTVGRPCCAPRSLTAFHYVYADEEDYSKLRIGSWEDGVATECGCA